MVAARRLPSYGEDGGNKRELFSEHKRDGMVNSENKHCGHHGCSKGSSCGGDGSKKKESCSEHKKGRDGGLEEQEVPPPRLQQGAVLWRGRHPQEGVLL